MALIIGILGEKLAGKDTAAEYIVKKYGATHIRTSKILDELLMVLGLPITRQNEIDVGKGVETMFGPRVIGDAVKKRVSEASTDIIIINGLRMKDQFEDAKSLGAKIIYITAPAETRFQRHLERGDQKDGAKTLEQFVEQDKTWTERDIPRFGAQADFRIDNTGTPEDLYKKIDEIIKQLH